MIQKERDGLEKIMDFNRVLSFILLGCHLYVFAYGAFAALGVVHPLVDSILRRIDTHSGIFSNPLTTKLLSCCLLLMSCLGSRGRKNLALSKQRIAYLLSCGLLIYVGSTFLLPHLYSLPGSFAYLATCIVGFLLTLKGGTLISRYLDSPIGKDIFNNEKESFPQEEKRIENEYSVNFETTYRYRGQVKKGYINVVNPFRATMVLGTPGSGKTFAILIPAIKQSIAKGYTLYVYDYKFDDLSREAYNALLKYAHVYETPPKFYVINFDDPTKSHRCNPLLPHLMTDIVDAYEAAATIMLNLNKSWIKKQGEFFVESPINFVAGIIWFLKLYQNGKYCTFPHVIEFLGRKYEEMFPILGAYPQIENLVRPFVSAFQGGAMEQLEGQIASARIPLSRLASPQLYWVMSGNDFTLDINNPDEPKVVCIGNNPDRQIIYGAALGLYNARLVKLVNKKGKLKSALFIDELPTIYFKGIDNLIATARSNKVATWLGFQDFSQLDRDYGKEEATVIRNTVGNVLAGQVVADTAEVLSKRFGRINQIKQTITENRNDTSHASSEQLEWMIPPGKIANLSQGTFVGAVADNFEERIDLKIFHASIKVDVEGIKKESKTFQNIPLIQNFTDKKGNQGISHLIEQNYHQIKKDIEELVGSELARIGNNSLLAG